MPLRVPQEPDPSAFPDRKGVLCPMALDFRKPVSSQEIHAHIQEHISIGVALTNVDEQDDRVTPHVTPAGETKVDVQIDDEVYNLAIRHDLIAIAGTAAEGLGAIRHACKLPIAPDYFLDVMNRLSYTSAVGKYTCVVEPLQDIDISDEADVNWCHIERTVDRYGPAWMVSLREFLPFDFLSEKHGMVASRSCLHPAYEVTPPPSRCCPSGGNRYRSPLIYYNRVLKDPSGDPNSCISVQFQYSDIGGFLTVDQMHKGITEFAAENIPKMFKIAKQAQNKGLSLGKDSEGYLENPLKPKWRVEPSEMIPGL